MLSGNSLLDTAVVILSYNSKKWHELFLPGILSAAGSQYEVYVVDHASTDDTSAYIQQSFPSVHLIRLNENHGFAWGYATALKQIEAKYYVLLSADFEVTPNWFAPLRAAFDTYPQLGACQPKIRYYKDREYFEYAGAAGGYMDKWGYLFCRGRIFGHLEKDFQQYNDDVEVFWASGGCLMVNAQAYHEVGGLDPDLFAHMEEVDLCWRLQSAGYTIGAIGNTHVFHVGGSVISYGSPQKTFYNFRNNLVLLLKNERLSKLFWLIPLRLVLDGVAGVQFLAKGQFKNIWAIIRAHFAFYGQFGKWYGKRKHIKRTNPHPSGVYSKSIIIQHFFFRKQTFKALNWLPSLLKK